MEHELYRQHARQHGVLTELIAFDSDGRAVWPAQQLRRALRDQLSSSLTMAMIDGELVEHLAAAADPPLATFEELLHHRHPPLDLLYLVKYYAKLILHDSPGGVHVSADHSSSPPDVALLLYYGSIAAALLRLFAMPEPTRAMLGQRGREWVLGHFDAATVTAQIVRIYDALSGRHPIEKTDKSAEN
jgi:hypothetical protein